MGSRTDSPCKGNRIFAGWFAPSARIHLSRDFPRALPSANVAIALQANSTRKRLFKAKSQLSRFIVGRGFVVAVLDIVNDQRCRSGRSNRNGRFPRRRLGPSYHRYGFRCDLAPIPYAFRPLQFCLLGTVT